MKKLLATILASALIGFSYAPSASAEPPPPKLVCDTTVTGGTYHSVTVPTGASCTLRAVTVLHNIKGLHAPKDVLVLDSNVGGNILTKRHTGLVHVGQAGCRYDPPVRGNIIIRGGNHVLVCWVTGHNLQVTGNYGRITVRDSSFHQVMVNRNLAYRGHPDDGDHRRPGAIRVLRVESHKLQTLRNDRAVIVR